jgi:hypothetical protein
VSKRTALLLFILLVACGGQTRRAAAQQRATTGQTPPTTATPTPATQAPQTTAAPATNDLEITANVTARSLRFEVVPEPKVIFTGRPRRDTVWEAERQNLPRAVEPGVTYRNIGIQLKITSRFADIERIVAEALGEVPVTDDANTSGEGSAPASAQPPANTPPPTPAQGRKP